MQEQFSHYNPKTNRCYVELRVTLNGVVFGLLSRGNSKALKIRDDFLERFEIDYMERHLYDGQTGEELAYFQKGMKGTATPPTFIKDRANPQWYDASTTVDDLMADDRNSKSPNE